MKKLTLTMCLSALTISAFSCSEHLSEQPSKKTIEDQAKKSGGNTAAYTAPVYMKTQDIPQNTYVDKIEIGILHNEPNPISKCTLFYSYACENESYNKEVTCTSSNDVDYLAILKTDDLTCPHGTLVSMRTVIDVNGVPFKTPPYYFDIEFNAGNFSLNKRNKNNATTIIDRKDVVIKGVK